jgi:Xaa-Pro aminopeptidase
MGGVRIEDAVEVSEEGPKVLGTSTRELIEL